MFKTEKIVDKDEVKLPEDDVRIDLQQAFKKRCFCQAPSKGFFVAILLSLPLWLVLAYFIARF